jgi:hypothetical protein
VPTPEPGPTRPPTSSAPRPSQEPSASGDEEPSASGDEEPAPRDSSTAGGGGSVPPPSGGASGLGDSDAGQEAAAPVSNDAAPRLALDEPRLDLGSLEIDLLAGIDVWSVPAATLGIPGILLLVWVALQTVGAMAWIPAVKRLRGDDEPES